MAKRLFDLIFGLLGLILLSPIFIALALAIKLDSKGPVFFRQVRVGRYGREFRIHKFRTMIVGAEDVGPQITVGKDPRITPLGDWIRKYKLDELAQLIDVCTGRMSLVGPRPEVPEFIALYPSSSRSKVLSVRPGITDQASIEFRDENTILADAPDPHSTYVEKILPIKIKYYLAYANCNSLAGDIKIIAQTLRAIFFSGRR